MRNTVALATTVLMAALLISCAPTAKRWTHPNVPEDAWSYDVNACRRMARHEAEREIMRDEPFIGSGGYRDRWGRRNDFSLRMARFDANKRSAELFESCMRRRGYRQTADDDGS